MIIFLVSWLTALWRFTSELVTYVTLRFFCLKLFSLGQDQSFGTQVSSSVIKQATVQLSFTGQYDKLHEKKLEFNILKVNSRMVICGSCTTWFRESSDIVFFIIKRQNKCLTKPKPKLNNVFTRPTFDKDFQSSLLTAMLDRQHWIVSQTRLQCLGHVKLWHVTCRTWLRCHWV